LPEESVPLKARCLPSRPLGAAAARNRGTGRPFWSPDSRFLGFFAGGTVKKIAISGRPLRKICDFRLGSDGSWSPEGGILFDASQSPIQRVPADGGNPVAAVKADASRNERQVAWPEFLPDGRHFLYCAFAGNRGDNTYRVGSLDSNETRPLSDAINRNKYVPSADGQRFLLQTSTPGPMKPTTIVLNWPADLPR
jgi:Tol biopolymer transport system component